MSEIARWDLWDGQMSQSVSGLWVRYAAHEFEVERLATERDAARAEVERLTVERDKAQVGDDVALSALTSAIRERDAAQAEVERLIGERVAAQAETKRLIDRLAWAEARVDADAETGRIDAERDAAQAEVERLQASGQGMLDTSRATDEDIWREAFMRQLFDHDIEKLMGAADLALALYRKRWPR